MSSFLRGMEIRGSDKALYAFRVIIDHKSKMQLFFVYRLNIYLFLLTMHLSLHLIFSLSVSPHPVCCSAAVCAVTMIEGEMEKWREAQKRRQADYY